MASLLNRAVMLALAALYDATETLRDGPMAASLSVRGLLALLHARSDGRLEPYASFWRQCVWPGDGEPGDGYIRAIYARTL